jgi:hypothetical protein
MQTAQKPSKSMEGGEKAGVGMRELSARERQCCDANRYSLREVDGFADGLLPSAGPCGAGDEAPHPWLGPSFKNAEAYQPSRSEPRVCSAMCRSLCWYKGGTPSVPALRRALRAGGEWRREPR